MSANTSCVKIIGEPFLSAALAFKERYYAHREAWSKLTESLGGYAYRPPHGIAFKHEPPKGWTKKDKWGVSTPKKGNSALAEINKTFENVRCDEVIP